jgi:hypothetical protein
MSSIITIKSRRMRWAEPVARMVEMRNAYKILAGNPEGKIALGGPRRIWEYNIKMDLREIGWQDVEWIHLAQDMDCWRGLVNTLKKIRVP